MIEDILSIFIPEEEKKGEMPGIYFAFALLFLPLIFIYRGIANLFRKEKKEGELESFTIDNFFHVFFMSGLAIFMFLLIIVVVPIVAFFMLIGLIIKVLIG